MTILCDRCEATLPSRLVHQYEHEGQVVTGALCAECSPTGAPLIETDLTTPISYDRLG